MLQWNTSSWNDNSVNKLPSGDVQAVSDTCWLGLWRNSLETMTGLLPLAFPTLVVTHQFKAAYGSYILTGGDLASSSVECPSKRVLPSCSYLFLCNLCWTSWCTTGIQEWKIISGTFILVSLFQFSSFYNLPVPSDCSSLTFNLHPFVAEEKNYPCAFFQRIRSLLGAFWPQH